MVGYNTVDINPGYNMFAVNFKQMGENQSIKIDDLFPGGGKKDTTFTYGNGAANADKVMVWDNASGEYTTYFLYKKKPGNDATKDYRWVDSKGNLAVGNVLTPGKGTWYYHRGSGFNLEIKKQF